MSGGGAGVSISGITGGVKKMIQDIREIAGEHSDEDIYAMLEECSMDPNETAHRLLHLDIFHEVKKKRGKRKENVVIKTSDIPGKRNGARVGGVAKTGGGNFHSQNTPQVNIRRSFGGSKENGYTNMSKGHKLEKKIASASSRSVQVKITGKNIQDETPQAKGGSTIISSAELVPVSEVVKSVKISVPADGGKSLDLKLTPAKQENKCLASTSLETVRTDAISPGKLVHENQYAMSNGDAGWSSDKIENTVHHAEIVDTAKSQPTLFNGVTVNETVDCTEKQPISEDDISVVNEEASKLNVSDGHVVFPEHLQVPEAYKKKFTFGSFGNSWPLDGIPTSAVSTDMSMPAGDSSLVNTVDESSFGSSGITSSTVKVLQEFENSSYLQASLPMSNNTSHHFEHASSDVVIKIDEPKTESFMQNGRPDIAYHPSNRVFGYAPKPQLQAPGSTELQGGNFITSLATGVDQNGNIQPSGITHDTIPSPPPVPFLRQTYHPNFFPYGQYYPQFFVPHVQQQYLTHGGFPQQPLVPSVYLSPAAAGGIKYPHQQQKQQGPNAGTDDYIGVPSGYNPYVPYTFPYGLPPAVMPGNVAVDGDQTTQLKENAAPTTEQPTESSGEWMAGTGRTVSGMHINPFYNIAPGQAHPMVFPPTPTGFGPFGGVYHPSIQTLPLPQPTVSPHNQQLHPMGSAEPPPGDFYQQHQPSQGAHILRTNNKQ